jgi:Na+-driven multidrug efflux pump
MQPLFGQSYGAKNEKDLKYYFHAGILINSITSVLIFILLLFTGETLCNLFGADDVVLGLISNALPKFSWCFPVLVVNTIISAYLYSTKRSPDALILTICRGLVFNSCFISLLPVLFGGAVVWFAVGIAEAFALIVALMLLKHSERNGVVFR